MFLRSLIFVLIGTLMYINCVAKTVKPETKMISKKPVVDEASFVVEFETLFKEREKTVENAAIIYDEAITNSQKPVMIKYFMIDCGACRSVKKAFEKLAGEFKDQVTFIAIDIDQFEPLCDSKEIFSVPAFTYILNGKEVGRDMGPKSLGELRYHLRKYFNLNM